ncbi:gas vesicle protein GvpG [bacterium]|nr:gas vesicle protein GvpG [bacterium]
MAFLIDDILKLPFKGFTGIFKEIYKVADQELNSKEALQKKLQELQMRLEMGEISEEEYEEQEEAILDRLEVLEEAA